MLQWMGGSRRKVTTSRLSTQKRQKQYFEQRRRQQQELIPDVEIHLEENVSGRSSNERGSLDILSLKSLSTIAPECNSCCPNGQEALDAKSAGKSFESNLGQPTPFTLSVNPERASTGFASTEKVINDHSSNHEKFMKTSTTNQDPLKTELSVLDLLDDNDLECNLQENSVHEDHVSFSLGGLGKVGTETPMNSPPCRMSPHGGSSSSSASRNIKFSKSLFNDFELEVDAAIQGVDTSLNSKTKPSIFPTSGQVDSVENLKQKMGYPDNDMQFDSFNSRYQGPFCGKRAYQHNNDDEQSHCARDNFCDDDFLRDIQHEVPWEDKPQRDYMMEDCWKFQEPQNLGFPFKKPQFLRESYVEIPSDRFNLEESIDPVYPTCHTSNRNRHAEEFMPRYPADRKKVDFVNMAHQPNPQFFPEVDPRDNLNSLSFDSEESCSSTAVRGDIMDSVAKKGEKPISAIGSPKDTVKSFLKKKVSFGNNDKAQQGKDGVISKNNNVKSDFSGMSPEHPSSFSFDRKLKANDDWFAGKVESQGDIDLDPFSFHKPSSSRYSPSKDEKWAEGPVSAYPAAKMGSPPKFKARSSSCTPQACGSDSPFISHPRDLTWKPDLYVKDEIEGVATDSSGLTEVLGNNEPLGVPLNGYGRNEGEMKSEKHSTASQNYKLRKQTAARIDFFAMGANQIVDKEEGYGKCKTENRKIPGSFASPVQSPQFGKSAKSTATKFSKDNDDIDEYRKFPGSFASPVASPQFGQNTKSTPTKFANIFLDSDNIDGYQYAARYSYEAKGLATTPRKTDSRTDMMSPPDNRVMMQESYAVQFLFVQQILEKSVEDAKKT